ncbi:MAG: UDP-N-acetylglucosamine--N-acetylmuramyl-(pentapeptide) pyrophosphoryl-undecaprenol N-acetylglucosamine transferase [Gemmatimonadetes bacterium]|nr:UDP-N-acetylglucosamine--N-acetylmuramyl-(pentapeptide) pyrophosphoryl-undecaprenol N-acetylglucosamine transferase [Gemmatimonadota bacterium]
MSRVRIVMAGGGTGGHLYPGLAIARALVRLSPRVDPFFVGARRGIEREVLPTTEFPHALLDLHPLYRSAPWRNWRTLVGGVKSWRALSALARGDTPRGIVGTGGYAAGVALAWGRAHGVPTMLFEADSHPGLTTRVFAGGASALFLGFPEAAHRLDHADDALVVATGCPIEPPPVPRPDRAAARARWGFPADARVVLIVGGSQGARAINEAVAAWCDAGLPPDVHLIWSTGRGQADAYLMRNGERVRVQPYLAPIADAYAAADLAVARAGAMSIAELCAWEVPMILVPLPTAAQDHQTYNARTTEAGGAAVYLPQATLTAATLDSTVRGLLQDAAALERLRAGARARAFPDAATRIAHAILERLGVASA